MKILSITWKFKTGFVDLVIQKVYQNLIDLKLKLFFQVILIEVEITFILMGLCRF